MFAEAGYEGASIRRIAAEAGVDPALVHHYFGSKEELFHAAVEPPVDPATVFPAIFAGDRDGIPERLLRAFLGTWENPVTGAAFRALLRRAVTDRLSSRLVREFFVHQIQRNLVAADLGIPQEEVPLRSGLVASQLFGLAVTRYILEFEPLASASHETIVAAVGPTLGRYLSGVLTTDGAA